MRPLTTMTPCSVLVSGACGPRPNPAPGSGCSLRAVHRTRPVSGSSRVTCTRPSESTVVTRMSEPSVSTVPNPYSRLRSLTLSPVCASSTTKRASDPGPCAGSSAPGAAGTSKRQTMCVLTARGPERAWNTQIRP